jgi:hypothetical protein
VSNLDSYFDSLRGQRPAAPFAEPEAVRRRGRARQRRQVVLAGVAVLALAASGGWVVTQAVPSPQPPPLAGQTPGAAPPTSASAATWDADEAAQWTLDAGDLGPGWREADHELLEGPWYWGECEDFPQRAAESLNRQSYVDAVSFLNGDVRLSQVLERYRTPEDAAANLRDVRNFLIRCSRPLDDRVAPTIYEFLTTAFAGDDSLLVRSVPHHFVGPGDHVSADPSRTAAEKYEPLAEYEQYVAVVLVGEFVTTLISTEQRVVREAVSIAVDRLS